MPSWLNNAVLLFACINLYGCATLYDGVTGPKEIHITSTPEDAQVVFEDKDTCKTPCDARLFEVKEQKIIVTSPGQPPQEIQLVTRINPVFWVNLIGLQWGVVGMAIDWYDHHMWTFVEDTFHLDFAPQKPEVQPEAEPAQELPNSPELVRIKEMYPEEYMERQVRNYYGDRKDVARIVIRLYKIMIEMLRNGEKLDVDEAVRRDQFS